MKSNRGPIEGSPDGDGDGTVVLLDRLTIGVKPEVGIPFFHLPCSNERAIARSRYTPKQKHCGTESERTVS